MGFRYRLKFGYQMQILDVDVKCGYQMWILYVDFYVVFQEDEKEGEENYFRDCVNKSQGKEFVQFIKDK